MNNHQPRVVSFVLGVGITFFPILAFLTCRKGYSFKARFFSFFWLFFVMAVSGGASSDDLRTERQRTGSSALHKMVFRHPAP